MLNVWHKFSSVYLNMQIYLETKTRLFDCTGALISDMHNRDKNTSSTLCPVRAVDAIWSMVDIYIYKHTCTRTVIGTTNVSAEGRPSIWPNYTVALRTIFPAEKEDEGHFNPVFCHQILSQT